MKLPHVLVSLEEEPQQGPRQMMTRMVNKDKNAVARAAEALEMSDTVFMRTVLVHAAYKVLQDLNITFTEDQEEQDATV